MNDKGELLNFVIKQGNVDEREPLKNKRFVNDEQKNICKIEHSRHWSFCNFITNMISRLTAYSFLPNKLGIKYETTQTNQIAIF